MFKKVTLSINSENVEADAPYVISASRATDIPAFYADWFISRVRNGFCSKRKGQGAEISYTSFKNCKVFVFWTKNPIPLLPHLDELIQRGYRFYFQYTINNFGQSEFEPNLPPLPDRLKAFEHISNTFGKKSIVWRFDPIFVSNRLDVKYLLSKIGELGNRLSKYTNKLVFSFADLHKYPFVEDRLKKFELYCRELDFNERFFFIKEIALINKRNWSNQLEIATCAETGDWSEFGIKKNRCIDPLLIEQLIPLEKAALESIGFGREQLSLLPGLESKHNDKQSLSPIKDKSQRNECGCVPSKDIGEYNSCRHGCVYCYAVRS